MSQYVEPDVHLFRDAALGVAGGLALVAPLVSAAWYCRETMALWALAIAHIVA